MLNPVHVQTVLQAAIARLLRPLFRLMLRHSMSYRAFADLAKRVYIDVVMQDFAIEGKKPSISRASILSGLTRKEVQQLLIDPPARDEASGERYNRAARVLTGWVRDADFHDEHGRPRVLRLAGAQGFSALVRRYSGDMPARAVLDELMRVGAVRHGGDGIELLNPAYVPVASAVDKLAILGSDVADLIDTIDHNIQHGAADPRFQRKVMYESIPRAALPAFRRLGAAQAQRLLERLDRWLDRRDRTDEAVVNNADTPRVRVGMGIYYFEEPVAPSLSQGDRK
jgi:hypothetical protein